MTWFAFLFMLLGISWVLVGIYRNYARNKGLLDIPNNRSSHIAPTPRGGGVVFFVCWIGMALGLNHYHLLNTEFLFLFSPVLLVGSLGFYDDHYHLSTGLRFIIQCIAAAASLFLLEEGGHLIHPWLGIPLPLCFVAIVIAMVWMINLFNFMDGSDGIAASESIIIFSCSGFLLMRHGAHELATLAWGLAALVSGFLIWNWPTAKVFMGDCGSYFLGFILALFMIISYKFFNFPLIIWVILSALFWFDTTITLLRRILAGEPWRQPHKRHAYQRLIQSGWSHQRVLLATLIVNIMLCGLAYVAYQDPRHQFFALGMALVLLSALYILVEIAKPMFIHWQDKGQGN